MASMVDDPDGGWGRLLAGLALIGIGLLFLFSGPGSTTGPKQFVPDGARPFAFAFIAVGVYQTVRGWGFDISEWRARRKRRRR
jgi:hypothetical protein